MNSNRSVLAASVLCMLSILVVGAVVCVSFSALRVSDGAVAAAFDGGDGSDYMAHEEDRLDYRIEDEDALDWLQHEEDRLDGAPDSVEVGSGSPQSAIMALYFAEIA